MEVFFLNPMADRPKVTTQVLNEITTMIRHTPGLLRAAIAYFTHGDIADALIERSEKAWETRLLLNTSDLVRPINPNESEIVISKHLLRVIRTQYPLQIQSLGVHSKAIYQNMHHKFMVSSTQVIFGSLNWTSAALNNNFECVAVADEPDTINAFSKEFDILWDKSQSLFTSEGKIRMIICPKCRSAEGVDFESWGPFCLYCGHRFKVA